MTETSTITLSKSALQTNIDFIQKIIGGKTELVSVVKGNAYGHDIKTFVPMANECGIKSFAVFSAFEAHQVLETQPNLDRLMIMGALSSGDIEWVIKNKIDFFLFNESRLEKAIKIAKQSNEKARIHIEIDTGLHRTGFKLDQLPRLIKLLKEYRKNIIIEGVCTHLAGAEDVSNHLRVRQQIKTFNAAQKILKNNGIQFKKAHAACSAAIINYPKTILDMVRVGIMQYGFWPSKEVKVAYFTQKKDRQDPLSRVISWKSHVIDVREVEEGEYIGYGRSFLAESDMKIAIVPVGYAHGYSRSLSNIGKAIINNTRVSVVGIVNMNMVIFDVTNTPNTKEGDEAILIGKTENLEISVASFSDLSDQLNYELLTRLPNSIPRIPIA